jgi:hypothetical protein
MQQQERVAVQAADVLAEDEDARVGRERIAHAEHDRFEEGRAFLVERRRVLHRQRCRPRGHRARVAIQNLHPGSRHRILGEDAGGHARRVGPRSADHRLRFRLDHRLGLAPETIEIARLDEALRFKTRGVGRDRIACPPELVEIPVRIAARRQRRVLP